MQESINWISASIFRLGRAGASDSAAAATAAAASNMEDQVGSSPKAVVLIDVPFLRLRLRRPLEQS